MESTCVCGYIGIHIKSLSCIYKVTQRRVVFGLASYGFEQCGHPREISYCDIMRGRNYLNSIPEDTLMIRPQFLMKHTAVMWKLARKRGWARSSSRIPGELVVR